MELAVLINPFMTEFSEVRNSVVIFCILRHSFKIIMRKYIDKIIVKLKCYFQRPILLYNWSHTTDGVYTVPGHLLVRFSRHECGESPYGIVCLAIRVHPLPLVVLARTGVRSPGPPSPDPEPQRVRRKIWKNNKEVVSFMAERLIFPYSWRESF